MQVRVHDFDNGKTRNFAGTRATVYEWLEEHFASLIGQVPDTVEEFLEALNETGYVQAEIVRAKDSNLLPVDYLTHDQGFTDLGNDDSDDGP